VPELRDEVPSDEALQAYCEEHLRNSIFSLIASSRLELERTYAADIVLAIETLHTVGGERFCELAMSSILDSLRRLNRLPRTDPFWVNTNKRPTIYKLPDFCKGILIDEPHDVLSLWTLGSITVWSYSNQFGQHYWERLYRLGQVELTSALTAALLIQITSNDTAQQFAEFLQESDAIVEGSSHLTRLREHGAAFLCTWVDRVLACMRTSHAT